MMIYTALRCTQCEKREETLLDVQHGHYYLDCTPIEKVTCGVCGAPMKVE